jgi:NADH/F420H2 dehydrogenase subunit C
MDNEKLKARILELLPEATQVENCQVATYLIPAEKMHAVVENLKKTGDTAFDYLFDLTAVDTGKELVMVYHLNSTEHGHDITLKAAVAGRENPEIDTVTDLYRAAEFYEREVYDLFGINFRNHPDMRRIFMDENWKGYPLRKDYIDEINIVEL